MIKIPLFKVYMNPFVDEELLQTVHSGYIGQGEKVSEFEKVLGKRIKNPLCLTLSAGTHGLHLALILAGVKSGTSVITTSLTCLSYRTSIETDKGFIPLGKIVNQKLKVKVKTLNRQTNKIEWKKATNWIKLLSTNVEWYTINLKNGNSTSSKKFSSRHVWITGDHNILTNRGYVRVDAIKIDDMIATDNKKLNSKQYEFVTGTLLGDSNIQKTKKTARLNCGHSVKQSEWFNIKAKNLDQFDFSFNRYPSTAVSGEVLKGQTSSGFEWKQLRKKWYDCRGKKTVPKNIELTPLVLATWYMDDGHLYSTDDCAVICTEGFNCNDFWFLFYKFVELGLKPTVHKRGSGYRLYIGNGTFNNRHNSFKKFCDIISPYIIPELRYKLPANFPNNYKESLWELGEPEIYYDKLIVKRGKPPQSQKPNYVYCIEVEDNHNFISKNIVMSNCTATNWPILMQGADIIWADIQKDSLNIDPKSIREKITANTKAIMCMHWGGYPCDMEEIKSIGEQYNIPIIEDAAHAFGATYKNSIIGDCGYSNYTMFSFQAIKTLTTVDGGALFLKSKTDFDRGKLLRWYGIDREGLKRDLRCEGAIFEYGFKYHMNDVCATIGLKNLERVDKLLNKAKENVAYYRKELQNISGITLIQNNTDRTSSNWLFTILVEERTSFANKMGEIGVHISRVHERNDIHPCVKKYAAPLPVLDSVIDNMICLPCGWWVTEEDREYIVDSIKSGW